MSEFSAPPGPLLPTPTPLGPSAHGAAPPSLVGMAILFVEDDADLRATTLALLRREGAVVRTAQTADEAIAALRDPAHLDLLLSDVMLPGELSGLDVVDVCRVVRPSLPALLASGHAVPEEHLGRARPEGVGLLRKPYRRVDLIGAISRALTG